MNNKGFSLLGALVAVAIMGIVMATMAKAFSIHIKSSKNLSIRNDKESIKVMLLSKLDCKESFKKKCKAGDILTVYSNKSKPIMDTYGEYKLRAECNSTGDSILFKVTRMKNGKFLPHPLFKTTIDWNNPKSLLFVEGVEMCGEYGVRCYDEKGKHYGHYTNGKCVPD